MGATLVKSVKLRITADDGDTEAKLDDISRKADELAAKHPELKVRIDTAAAAAKLAVLKKELKDTGQQAQDSGGRFSAFRDGVNALTLGLSGGVGTMTMFQKAMWAMNLATGLGEPLVAGVTVAVGALGAGLVSAGLGLGIFGLVAKAAYSQVSGAVTSYQTALSTTGKASATAMAQYRAQMAALTPQQRELARSIGTVQNSWQNFVASNTAGVTSILKQGMGLMPKIFAAMQPFLGPTEKALHGIISDLGHGLDSAGFKSWIDVMAKASGPMITGFAKAIGNIVVGLGGILKAFMPVSHGVVSGLDSITAKFREWGTTLTGHSGFQSLMGMFRVQTPMAVNALKALAGIVLQVGKSMTGLDTFSNSKMLFQLATPILQFVSALLKAHPELVWLTLYLKLAYDGGKKLQTAFSGISAGLGVLKGARSAVQDLSSGFSNASAAASDATGVWGTFGGKISTVIESVKSWGIWSKVAAGATKVWTGIQAAFDLVMDANPIALLVIGIAALVAAIVVLTVKFKWMRDFWKDAWKDIKTVAVDGFHVLEDVFKVYVKIWTVEWDIVKKVATEAFRLLVDAVKLWVRSWTIQWDIARTVVLAVWHGIEDVVRGAVAGVRAVLSWFGRLGGLFRGWWEDAANAVYGVTERMIGFVRTIPGRILSALASLAGMLFRAGQHAMSSLIGGFTSMIGSLGSAIGGIASKVAGFFGLSPAKEGPLSGGGAPRIRGQHFAADVAAGMLAGRAGVSAAAMQLARAAGLTAGGQPMAVAGGGGSGGGWMELRVEGAQSANWLALVKALWPDLRLEVRQKGGGGPFSAQRALGETVPAG